MSDLVEIGTVKLTGILVFIGLLGLGFVLGFVAGRIFPAKPETRLIKVGTAKSGPICDVYDLEGQNQSIEVDLSDGKTKSGSMDYTIEPCLKP